MRSLLADGIPMRRVCVFCGSSLGSSPHFVEAADALGQTIAASGLDLVYGGSHLGLMGRVADAALRNGGRVIGVIPESMFSLEIAHTELSELRVVSSMHERKALMEELSDGFIALPGGMGTLEEFAEVFTWFQLGFHNKPCGLLNVDDYFTPLLQFFSGALEHGFLTQAHSAMLLVEQEPVALLSRLRSRYR